MKAFVVSGLGASLMYHDMPGDGPPIVLIHGLGCASSCDYPIVTSDPVLAGRRKLLVDLLGSGFSERPADFEYTIEGHARIVADFLSEVCPEPIDLFGHSMGGAIAIAAAARLGRKVRRIALGEPNLDAGGGAFSRQIASMTESDYVMRGHEGNGRRRPRERQYDLGQLAGSKRGVCRTSRSSIVGGRVTAELARHPVRDDDTEDSDFRGTFVTKR